jgi:putative membrane protein insertion efficiency factor
MPINKILVKFLLGLITAYQYAVSPFLPRVCRFYPTCSEYAKQALLTYGLIKGLYVAGKRILRCNPFFTGGYDPVTKE